MEDIIFLSTEDIYTYHVLDEGYMGGMLNEDASKAFATLASRIDKIESTYSSLFEKSERTPEEDDLYNKCFSNLVLESSMRLWNSDGDTLISSYREVSQEPTPNSSQVVLKEALKSVIERKGLELPEVGKSL